MSNAPNSAVPPGNAELDTATLSQWQLIVIRFRAHKLAVVSFLLLVLFLLVAAFAEIVAPYPSNAKILDHTLCPPQPIRFNLEDGFHVRAMVRHVDPITFKTEYVELPERRLPLGLFVKGEPYDLWGLIPWDRHLVGVEKATSAAEATPTFFLFGTDRYGRDLLSRIIYGSRISLSIGLVAIVVTFFLGILIGGISGYLGGAVDNVIQRVIEVIGSLPNLPLWLALGAAMPADWTPLQVYFSITIVLSLINWTGLARVVRGKLLALREEDYVTAAKLLGASHKRIIFLHLVPGFTSHIIVTLTLSVPGMILGETSLSFLGLGLRPPVVSWGVMLQDCMNLEAMANYPWLLMPMFFIITVVLCFNFLGDGLRDAADPYASR